jgi:hypothetical protein
MRFLRLDNVVINSDRVLAAEVLSRPSGEPYAIGLTYDTGQSLIIETAEPKIMLSNYFESVSASPTDTM